MHFFKEIAETDPRQGRRIVFLWEALYFSPLWDPFQLFPRKKKHIKKLKLNVLNWSKCNITGIESKRPMTLISWELRSRLGSDHCRGLATGLLQLLAVLLAVGNQRQSFLHLGVEEVTPFLK